MKRNDAYTELICRRFCRFYKEGREELACGSYRFLLCNVSSGELRSGIRGIRPEPDYSCDEQIEDLVCKKCDFLAGGCDFREGLAGPPCGGYAIIEWLLRKSA